ncbi:CopG family transcriptional regulator [Desulfobacter sp.]|uniref:ribbon-helix-helix domain-containing protein n=1 Tax=Desulfobacter sp. TaxID=2294 RepID=UPI003D0F4ADD
MIRTQIYLTDQQRAELATLAEIQGKKQSELIREAIDILIEQASHDRRKKILCETAGIWKNRSDLPDFKKMRSEWDRE